MSLPRHEQVRNLKKGYSKTDLALLCVQLLDDADEILERLDETQAAAEAAETELKSLQARTHAHKPGDQCAVLITTSGSGVLRASGVEHLHSQEIQIWERVATSYNRYEAAEMALALNNQYKREND